MARIVRTRNRGSPYTGGSMSWLKNGASIIDINPNRSGYTSTCTDNVGSPVVDSFFSSQQYTGVYPALSGTLTPTNTAGVDTVRFQAFTTSAIPSEVVSVTPLPVPNGWLLDLISGTNPSRPVLNIPEAIENLVDLPKMVKSLGDTILHPGNRLTPKGFAGEYLGVQFGWLPLIDDLTKLLNVQHYVLKRNKELNQLYSGRGLRRRLKFADDTTSSTYTDSTSAYTATVNHTCSVMIKKSQWATIRWKPTTPPPYHPDDARWNDLSRRIVLGATPEGLATGLWKVIPWTWLIGWFTNFGKFGTSHSWTIPAAPGSGCFMNSVEASYSSASVSWSGAANASIGNYGTATRTSKQRTVSSTVMVGANMPYLDMFRLSILGSLFAQRFL